MSQLVAIIRSFRKIGVTVLDPKQNVSLTGEFPEEENRRNRPVCNTKRNKLQHRFVDMKASVCTREMNY